MAQKIYITTCEGPVSKNNIAYEIAEAFLSEGGRLFNLLNTFDDYLGAVEKMPGHRSGSALTYLLPFLRAAGATDKAVRAFSQQHINLMNGVSETIASLHEIMDIYLFSTDYIHSIEEIAKTLRLEPANVLSTKVFFDDYEMGEGEIKVFTGLQRAILQLPPISWNEANIVPFEAQFSIDALKTFLFEHLPALPIKDWIKSVKPLNSADKAAAILDITNRKGILLEDVIYVGDSIADVAALSLVKENGGLSISFNGSRDAALNAEYLVVSRETDVLREIALTFLQSGKKDIREGTVYKNAFVSSHESCEVENVIIFSENMRKEVRGEATGDPE